MGGLVKKIRLDLSTRHRRKKASAATVRAVAPSKPKAAAKAKAKKRWEFTLPSHPKAKRKDAAEVPQKVLYAPTEDENKADDGYAGITELFGGWLASLTSCFGLYVEGAASATSDTEYYTTDDSSGDVDDDDWSDESTQPSLSMLNRVLKLPARPDDVSDITSAASISIDDSESFSTAGS